MAQPPRDIDDAREFAPEEYASATSWIEQLADAGVPGVRVERWGHGSWHPLFAGPAALGVYNLARLESAAEPPRIRVYPMETSPPDTPAA